MAYEIIPNVILFTTIVAVLVILFRHVPEVVDTTGANRTDHIKDGSESSTLQNDNSHVLIKFYKHFISSASAISKNIWNIIKTAALYVAKKVWHFMLEAKDLKQGQILASKFARIVTPSSLRYTNSAVHMPMVEAEELLAAGKFGEAEQKYFDVIKDFPHEYTAYEGLVKIYIQEKQFDNLTETLEYLVKHVPENDVYWAQYGNVLMSTRHYEKAVDAYKESIKFNNLIPARYANLGLSYQALNNKEAAAENLDKACELEPANEQYLELWVELMLQLDGREKCIERLSKVVEMFPEKESIAKRLAELKIPIVEVQS
jgi:tetratricopeptide (TPR) repeat protein